MADYYADSVNGNDANAGTSEALAFKTLSALLAAATTHGNGVILSLSRGSHWRESLDLSALTSVTIEVHGYGNLPIIDGADVFGTWSKTAARTNVYEASVAHDATGTDRLTVYENGDLLTRVVDQATCDSTAGSFVDVKGTDGSPVTVYIHPNGSTIPGSDGKTYEVSTRTVALALGLSATVDGAIHVRRAIAGGGAATTGKDVLLQKMLASWGTKHCFRIGSGTVRDCIAAYIDPPTSYEPSNTFWVGYSDDITGETLLVERCGSIGTGSDEIANSTDWTAHDAGSGVYDSVILRQCWAVDIFVIYGPGPGHTVSIVEGWYGIHVGNIPEAKIVRYFQARDLTYVSIPGAATVWQDGAVYIYERYANGVNDEVIKVNEWPLTIQRCAFTGLTSNTEVMDNTAGSGTLTIEKCIFDGGVLHIDLAAGTTYVGDYNVFLETNVFAPTERFLARDSGTYYTTLASWQAAQSQDLNSVYLEPADQTLGGANAFWLSVADGRGKPELTGDFRINPSARAYGSDGTAYIGTFADGTTPLTDAGPQTHWDWGARATADGPPTAWPVVPETLEEAVVHLMGFGTVALPEAAEVLDGVAFGIAGSEDTGTVVLPAASSVLDSVSYGPSSGTAGTYHAPEAAEVVSTAVFGPASATSGAVVLPGAHTVLAGETYGASSGTTGTLVHATAADTANAVRTELATELAHLDTDLSDLATAAALAAVAAKTSLISSGSVTITSPVSADGTTITVVQGDDYSNDDGRAITWTGTDADQWPDLTGATLEFTARMKGAADITAVPTVVTPTGTQVFRMELSSTDTDVTTGRYRYDVQATLDGGNVATLLNGAFVVQRTYTDAP